MFNIFFVFFRKYFILNKELYVLISIMSEVRGYYYRNNTTPRKQLHSLP